MAKKNNGKNKGKTNKIQKLTIRVTEINPFANLSKVSRSKSPNSLWQKLGIKSSKSTVWVDKNEGVYYLESDYKTYKSQKIVKRGIENKAKKLRSRGLVEDAANYLKNTFLGKGDSKLLAHSKEFNSAKRNIIKVVSIGANREGSVITREDFLRLNEMIEKTGLDIQNNYGENIVIDISLKGKFENRYNGENHLVGIGQMSTGAFIKRGIKSIDNYMQGKDVLFFPISITIRKKEF